MDGRDKVTDELRELVSPQAAQIEKLTARISDRELQLVKAKKDSKPRANRVRVPPTADYE